MADVLLVRDTKLYARDNKIVWTVDTAGTTNCCCTYMNCCVGDKDAEVVIQGLAVNPLFPPVGSENTCTGANCVAINQTYLVSMPGRSVVTCCAFGTLSLPAGVCQLGTGHYLKVILQLNQTVIASSLIEVSYGMRNPIAVRNHAMVWRETGANAVDILWDICSGVQREVPFLGHFQPGFAGAEVQCGNPNLSPLVTGVCDATLPCLLNLI